MTPVRSHLLDAAGWLVVLAVGLGALMVLVFDWSLSQTIRGGLLGGVLWSVFDFVTNVRHQLPDGPRLVDAPAGTTLSVDRWRPLRMLLWLPVFVGVAWLVDRWKLGAVFVPGQLLGYALSSFIGALVVGRWQSRHGGTVLVRWNADETELYVASDQKAWL